jgi:hypothetical protein
MNFEQQARQAITELTSAQTKHLNRLLALEAMMEALLDRVDPRAVAGIAEEYEAALDRLAADLPPGLQRPELWQQWTTLLADMQQSRQQKAPPDTRGAG